MCNQNQLAFELSKSINNVARSVSIKPDDLQNLSSAELSNKLYEQEIDYALMESKPWKKDKQYFKNAFISSVALMKMSIHARSGGSIEIMGMMTGKIIKDSIIVMDVYSLPVEGTETRVNAQNEAYEYMVQYLEGSNKVGRNDNIVGWYHSHPGYGCWLSGIDVATQSLNQSFQDPYLAVVIDPEKTISKGMVEIGAFRTYPEDTSLQPPTTGADLNQTVASHIPKSKMKDFGAHSDKYYSLKVSIFKSELDGGVLDTLWSKYWTSNISNMSTEVDTANEKNKSSYLIQQISDITSKLKQEEPPKYTKFDKQAADIYNTMNQNIKNNRNKALLNDYDDEDDSKSLKNDDDEDQDTSDEDNIDKESPELEQERDVYSIEGSPKSALEIPGYKNEKPRFARREWKLSASTQDRIKTKLKDGDSRKDTRALEKLSRDARILGAEEIRNLVTLKMQQQMFLGCEEE